MARRRNKLSQVIALASLCALAALPLLADTRGAQLSQAPPLRCYCQCESKGEHSVCPKKMCDLKKYESRWWAVSCRKPAAESSTKKEQPTAPSKARTRAILNAKR
jgi:hypothetical protein